MTSAKLFHLPESWFPLPKSGDEAVLAACGCYGNSMWPCKRLSTLPGLGWALVSAGGEGTALQLQEYTGLNCKINWSRFTLYNEIYLEQNSSIGFEINKYNSTESKQLSHFHFKTPLFGVNTSLVKFEDFLSPCLLICPLWFPVEGRSIEESLSRPAAHLWWGETFLDPISFLILRCFLGICRIGYWPRSSPKRAISGASSSDLPRHWEGWSVSPLPIRQPLGWSLSPVSQLISQDTQTGL